MRLSQKSIVEIMYCCCVFLISIVVVLVNTRKNEIRFLGSCTNVTGGVCPDVRKCAVCRKWTRMEGWPAGWVGCSGAS